MRLQSNSPIIGDVRGRGLLAAIELVTDRETNGRFPDTVDPAGILRHHGPDQGLLLHSRRQNGGRFGDWLVFAPPLTSDETVCDDLLARLAKTLEAGTTGLLQAARAA